MPGHTNRESYNKKQTPSDLKDLLIPRQKVSAIFSCLTISIHSHSLILISYISLMLKQQASLFVAYKGQLTFYKSLSKKKNQSNQHSVYIKSALIIIFTQSCIQVMINMIKPSFMFPVLFFKISSGNISIPHMLKMRKQIKMKQSHEFHSSFSSQRPKRFVQQKTCQNSTIV